MEGVYSGPYANDNRDRAARVDDVSHQRLALHARRAGLWIVDDRLRSPGAHDYEQLWWFPLQKKELAAFQPGDIVADEASRTIKTRRTRTDTWWSWDRMDNVTVRDANVSMYQFADGPLKYAAETRPSNEEQYDFRRVGVSWHGTGNQQVITAIFPRKPTPEGSHPTGTENDLDAARPIPAADGASGFEAVTPDGDRVTYLAAKDGIGTLESGGIRVAGEALLVVRGRGDGDGATGIVLGGKSMTARGGDVRISHPDFEFALPARGGLAAMQTTPIYRPIAPVQILPEADVFAGEAEVRLASATPGVAITYTLDGTDPTPRSTPYAGPFKVDRSVVVKARAYRPGMAENPPQASGTHATPASFAPFTKVLPYEPSDVNPASPGLHCEYFEGFWKDLWLSLDKLQPRVKGAAAGLFDLALIPDENRRVGEKAAPREKSYALRYTGFLKAPEDGVYTLHAPREFVQPEGVAGYELQVSLGHATIRDAGVIRRAGETSRWYPATRLHGLGTWSVPLKKGFHELKVVYIDYRMDGARRLNRGGGVRDYVWSGETPGLLISGPGTEPQPIPASWLWR